MTHSNHIVILDFGSQFTQLIARKVREAGVYAEIHPYTTTAEKIRAMKPNGIILSGGPSSVYADTAPHSSVEIYSLGVPVLGVCYGLQLLAFQLGGEVNRSAKREFGRAHLHITDHSDLFRDVPEKSTVWMSHGDSLTKLPTGFEIIANTENAPICAVRSTAQRIWGIQFHPEVYHTSEGKTILRNFVVDICGCATDWNAGSFIEREIAEIRARVGTQSVICALSGGVDSTVAAVLLHKAIGDQLHCIHVDSGLMRLNESATIERLFREHFSMSIDVLDASETFLTRLADVTDPEKKRKIIGNAFIELFEPEARKFNDAQWLVQGTLYPDVIESVSVKGPSQTIKTHHNVGGLPDEMHLKLIEPFRELFKDEVRAVGRELGIPEWFIERHPFPGPGLAIRVLGAINPQLLDLLRRADEIYLEEIRKADLYNEIWQAFAVILPIQSVGVMGDERTYENVVALRAVTSTDGMTADWYHMPYDVLAHISNRIINEVRGINRVVYDISSKPPATIEWE